MNMLRYITRNATRAISLLAALLICSTAGAATYYVDAVNGNDSNSGVSTSSAWRTLGKVNSAALYAGDTVLFRRGDSFRGQLVPKSGTSSSYITYGAYGTGNKPLLLGSVRKNLTSDWVSEGGNIWTTTGTFSADVGNLILSGERSCGVKVFSRAELNAQGKFWFNESTGKVSVYSTSNPASAWSDIECAVSVYIINEAGKSWVIFENLALKYGGAHGIGGSGMSNIIIRDLEIGFIGGGKQDASGIRFGNGIEFIGSAQNLLVERCRIWDCYDAGLTNQNLSATVQNNIIYRNNTVWNCEYSFEYWSNQSGATTSNITFENNTCAFAGGGWGHAQRPFKTGRHLHFDDNRAATSNFSIRNNIFYQALDNNIYLSPTWNNLSALNMDYNCWHNSQTGNMAVWQGTYYPMTQFSSYQSRSGKDSHSLTSDPLFVNAGARDFHLTAGSPCINRGYTGSKDPDGSAADLGAFPYGSSVPNPSDTQAPSVVSVAISPNSGWVRAGSAVTITAAAGNSETGLTASNAQINGRSVPLSDQGGGTYRGVYTVQSADAQGVNIEASGITLRDPAGNVSASASSSGSTLRVDTIAPAVASVSISPNTGAVAEGSAVTITATARNNETGLIPSNVQINGRSVPLSDQGGGIYRGVYTVQAGDPAGVNVEASGITLRDPAGNVSAPASSSGSTLKVSTSPITSPTGPSISSVTISPNSGWVKAGGSVLITATAAGNQVGLIPSGALINGKSIPLSDRGNGSYSGTYVVQSGDNQGVNIEATGITLSTPGSSTPLFADNFSDNNISDWTAIGSVTCRNERLEVTANGIEDMVTKSFSTNLNEVWCTYRVYVSSLSLPASGDKSVGCGFISPNAAKGAYAGFVNSNGRPVWRIEYSTDTANVAQAVSSTPVTLGQWHTVTFMFKRSGGANDGQVKLWVDGVLAASQTGLDNDTIQAQKAVLGDRYGVNVNGVYYIDDVSFSNSQTGGTGQTSAPASSSGSTLKVDTWQPAISSVVISPNTGTIYPGSSVTVTASARNGEAGLIPSAAVVNSRNVPLWDRGNGTYSGVYVAQTGDPVGTVVEASGITLRDPAGNVSAPASSSGSTLKVAASSVTTAELLANPSFSVNADGWATYTEGGAAVSAGRDAGVYDSSPAGYRIQCISRGSEAHYIQFMTTRGMSITAGKRYTLTFRAKCTVPFTVNSIVLMKASSPWSWYQSLSTGGSPAIPASWTTCSVTFTASATASDARLTFYLGNSLANGAIFYLDSMSFRESASGGAAKIASAGAGMPVMPSAPQAENVSERSARLAWTEGFLADAPDGGCLLELRELTRGESEKVSADSSRVITPAPRSGRETMELNGLRPGARYAVSLRSGNDPAGGACRRAFMNLTTLAEFVDEDLDRNDPFIARDSDSLFVADNDVDLTFAWSSWKTLGAAAYRVTVHTHAPEGVRETRTITDTTFTFSGEPRQVYSVEIHPLTPDGEELGTISSRKILCAPASPGKPGNP